MTTSLREILSRIQNLTHTRIERVTANELGQAFPAYRQRKEIQILPNLTDLTEADQEPSIQIPPPSGYFDVY